MKKVKKVKSMTTSEIFVWFNYKREEGKTDIEIEDEFENLIKELQNENLNDR